MEHPDKFSHEEFDEHLAEEIGMSVEEFRERSDVEFGPQWDSETVRDYE